MSNARNQILETTCALLEKQGYHGTGLNEIIQKSGSPKGSLYYYFPDGKEQITSEAILQSGRETAERIRHGLSQRSNAGRAVSEFVMNIADHVERSGFAAGSPLTAVAMETATTSERINAACREAYAMLTAAFCDKLLECGYPGPMAAEQSQFIVAAIEGGIILSRTFHTADPLRRVARQLKALLAVEAPKKSSHKSKTE